MPQNQHAITIKVPSVPQLTIILLSRYKFHITIIEVNIQ